MAVGDGRDTIGDSLETHARDLDRPRRHPDRDASGSILCDPWFVPAFFGSWFVFPRNDQLADELLERIERPTTSTSRTSTPTTSTSLGCAAHLRRDIPILLPGYPTREHERTLAALGFTEFVRTVDGEELEIAPG